MLQLVRFGLVGLANTATSACVIFAAIRLGSGDYAANALGYAVGLCLSFALNRGWTFGVRGAVRLSEIVRFGAVVGLSYLVNLTVLSIMRDHGFRESVIGQGAAMVAYSVCFYILSRRFVFRTPTSEARQ
ncbi:GtrA family protein [Novosphingobium colocasiae]|uniref:GtrA/DPMS transmembrane domain-containing protein n=1 Tax=Novosphingobium colocasiae TaxID=1256513 RepID=A0A918UCE3_9SPHN|nr:GtrA family protein [Novosphingobium colocasiae]GGY91463.1 hypothetical protein GCM10011614_02690 [Novosphingobium colocasiae]